MQADRLSPSRHRSGGARLNSPGRKDFLPVEPQSGLSYLFLLGRTQVRLGVSERCSFLPTSSILNGMRENGWVPVRAQEQSVRTEARRGFQKHVVRFARVEHLQTWEKNQVRPEVVLVNSHDKSSAYQLHCGLFRLVCTNGMVVATFQWISIKHSGFNPDSVIEASFKVLGAVPDIMNKVQLFQDRILTDDNMQTTGIGKKRAFQHIASEAVYAANRTHGIRIGLPLILDSAMSR